MLHPKSGRLRAQFRTPRWKVREGRAASCGAAGPSAHLYPPPFSAPGTLRGRRKASIPLFDKWGS